MYSLRSKLPKANTQNIEPRWSRESLHHIWVKIWPHKHIWKLQNLKSRDKSISKELSCTYHWDILVSCTTQCHNNILLNFRSIYLFWGHLREVNLHLKMVAVAYEEVVDYKEVPNIVIWLENFRYFAKLVAYKRWSQLEVRLYFPFDGEYANRPVLTNPEKIANGVFTLKMHLKSFPSTSLRPRNHGKHNNQRVYFRLRKTRAAKSPDYRNAKVPKCVLTTLKCKDGVFKFLWFEERFRKSSFSWWISVDGRSNRRNKVTFSNSSVVVWTRPYYNKQPEQSGFLPLYQNEGSCENVSP